MNTSATIDWANELDRNRSWMLRVLRSRVGDAHAADDLMQDVSVAVLRQTSRPLDPVKVAPWLYRLTVRQAINFHRRAGRQKKHFSAGEVEMAVSRTVSPLECILAIEEQSQVQRVLDELQPKDREILMLKYAEQWTYEQIAQHTGAKVKTIEYRLMRARKMLRRKIVNGLDVGDLRLLAGSQAE